MEISYYEFESSKLQPHYWTFFYGNLKLFPLWSFLLQPFSAERCSKWNLKSLSTLKLHTLAVQRTCWALKRNLKLLHSESASGNVSLKFLVFHLCSGAVLNAPRIRLSFSTSPRFVGEHFSKEMNTESRKIWKPSENSNPISVTSRVKISKI